MGEYNQKSGIDSTSALQKKYKMGIKFIPFSPSARISCTVEKFLFASYYSAVF